MLVLIWSVVNSGDSIGPGGIIIGVPVIIIPDRRRLVTAVNNRPCSGDILRGIGARPALGIAEVFVEQRVAVKPPYSGAVLESLGVQTDVCYIHGDIEIHALYTH